MPWPKPAAAHDPAHGGRLAAGARQQDERAVSRAERRTGLPTRPESEGSGQSLTANRRHSPGTPLSSWAPALLELDSRAHHEVLHGARHEHLARPRPRPSRGRRCARPGRPRRRRSPRTRRCAGRRGSRCRARARRRRSRCAARIARAGPSKVARMPSPVDLTARPRWRSTSRRTSRVVALEHVAPGAVAQLGGALGGADDVGEQDRRQHAVGLALVARRRSGTPRSRRGSRRSRRPRRGCRCPPARRSARRGCARPGSASARPSGTGRRAGA